MSAYDVCVRGSGPVGMTLALALARQGLRVALQQEPPVTGQGTAPDWRADLRAYALSATSIALLSALKVWDAVPADARTPVYDMHIEGDAPGAHLDFSAWDQALQALTWIVDAGALNEALDSALRFAPHVTRVDHEVPAALLALAEGKHSATRAALGVQVETHAYGHRGVAARLVADRPHAGLARQWFRSPDVLALLPFDRPQAASSYGLVWSVPDARADELMAMPPAAFEQALLDTTAGVAGGLSLASERAAWPLMRAQAHPLCGPGWVLLGDAAHVVHPLAGQGLNLGLADVAALSQVIETREAFRSLGDEKLLRRYVRERVLPTRAMAQVTDGLLHLFANDKAWVKELRNRGLGLVNVLPPLKKLLTARALHS